MVVGEEEEDDDDDAPASYMSLEVAFLIPAAARDGGGEKQGRKKAPPFRFSAPPPKTPTLFRFSSDPHRVLILPFLKIRPLFASGLHQSHQAKMVFWEGWISDELMGTFSPIVVYWLYAGMYQLLPPLDQYRLHTRKEEEQKNLVPLSSVIKGVLLQQLVQATVAGLMFLITAKPSGEGSIIQPSLPVQLIQIMVAMLIMDTWQYFIHRYMHQNKLLYRHIHSQHHKLVVPYAIGALYNHPLEGLLLDTFGGAISFLISGMTARTAVFFFCFAVIKTVDDHCGLWLPGNIFHIIFQNNTAYHDVHHQLHGTKYNYSQPFFSIWDRLLGTYMPFSLVNRKEGGFEARIGKRLNGMS